MWDLGVVPDIVSSVIVVWVSGLIYLSFSLNAEKYVSVEYSVGAEILT